MLSWIAHATDSGNFGLLTVLAEDSEKEFFVSRGEGLVRWDVAFLMVVVIASERDDD